MVNKKNVLIYSLIGGIAILFFLMKDKINEIIQSLANKFAGVVEIGNNASFNNPTFLKLMKSIGWSPGDQWCMWFAKLIYNQAFKNDAIVTKKINELFNGSSQSSFNNVLNDKSGIFKAFKSGLPQINDIIIFQHLNNKTTGHAGVILSLNADGTANTIEGNTSDKNIYNGGQVALKKRVYTIGKSIGGDLVVRGYIRKM